TCAVQTGYTCGGAPSVCSTTCGDGVKAGIEACDDGNVVAGDGCSATCTVQSGFTCAGTAPSICTTICGDGIKVGAEVCDDGNTVSGDCCSSACQLEAGCEIEPNGAPATANSFSAIAIGSQIKGALKPVADIDYFQITTTSVVDIRIETSDGTGAPNCATAHDTEVRLFAANGTTQITSDDDGAVNGLCSLVDPALLPAARHLAAGTYYVSVEEHGKDAVVADYILSVTFPAICGNGIKEGSEQCDGGATCQADCVLIAVCGDGIKSGGETCDDGNAVAGDGCSATCTWEFVPEAEPNNTCLTANGPQVLGPVGTSKLFSGALTPAQEQDWYGFTLTSYADVKFETFDSTGPLSCAPTTVDTQIQVFKSDCVTTQTTVQDQGGIGNCSKLDPAITASVRHLAPGTYYVKVYPYSSTATFAYSLQTTVTAACGNGVKEGSEQCDGGAACQADCMLIPVCGDGVKSAGEACEDGNTADGDGCTSTCQVQTGYTCNAATPSVCTAICGDGLKLGAETCDDGNVINTDGCSSTCQVQPGYTCAGAPSACTTSCGDGTRAGVEQCDDSNTASNDGCSATCAWETIAEVEPNGTTAQADTALPAISGSTVVTGAITPTADLDIYKITVAAQTSIRFEIFDSSGFDCTTFTAAMSLKLLTSTGAVITQDVPASDTAASGISANCPALVVASVVPGTYYIQAQKTTAGTIAAYLLQVKYLTDLGNEVEPNDTRPQGTPMPGGDVVILGDHQASADVDYYAITFTSTKSIRAEVIEGDALKSCDAKAIDSAIALFNAAGTSLVTDDDDGRGYCSAIDGTGATPRDSAAHNLAAGTYYLQVIKSSISTPPADVFNYRLAVTVR
ncbi:MAG: DVUA0089 family protein, partial [Byssovorax sp.]